MDAADGFSAALAGATVNVFVKGDGNGSAFVWEGVNYYTLAEYAPSFVATLDTTAVGAADFTGGTVAGASTRVTLVPEPGSLALGGAGVAAFAVFCLLRRRSAAWAIRT